MKKLKSGLYLLLVVLAGAGLFMTSGAFSNDEPFPRLAPLNDEFIQVQSDPGHPILSRFTDEGFPLGALPSPFDASYSHYLPKTQAAWTPPAAWDLRSENKLTSVRNQGSCGSCWAFATYGSLESYLMPGRAWDFSEQNLIQNHGFDYGPCDGGHIFMSAAYLARWAGPANEVDDPYQYNSLDRAPVKKHVQNIMFIPTRSSHLGNDDIKRAVMTYGAVHTSMYWDNSCFNSATNSYYNKSSKVGGHAVTIVGWDDNYSKNNFSPAAPGNGAFIVRNSWGANWGESGCFYASYYDAFFGRRNYSAVVSAEEKTNYQDIYQYDELGWVNSFGFGSETSWFANIFTSNGNTPLIAVSFYTGSTRNSYEIYVYKDVSANNPRSGTRVLTTNGRIDAPGYFTIEFDRGINLSRNKRFSVVVKLTTNNYTYPIPVEYPVSGYSSTARGGSGESFVSSSGMTWYDLHTAWGGAYAHTNVCLKAFTGYPDQELTITAAKGGTTNPSPGSHSYDFNASVKVKAIPDNYYIFNGWSGDLSGTKNPETIVMDSDKSVHAKFRLVHAPSNASLNQIMNRSLFQGEYINVLKWESNSGNQGINIAHYRIYQMDGNQRNLVVELDDETYEYWHRDVDESASYRYALVAVTAGGREGQPVFLSIQ
jgi:C1A family cysteine protease